MALILLAFLSLASAWTWTEGRFGRCKHQEKLSSFDFEFFNQHFYQILRTKQPPFAIGDCYRPNIMRVSDTSYEIDVSVKIGGSFYNTLLYLQFASQSGRFGDFEIKIGSDVNHGNMISTDLQTYFVVYGCNSEKENRRDYFEIFATSPDFDYNPYLQLAYGLDFNDEDFYFPIQDDGTCS
jgi:hypothetical protein